MVISATDRERKIPLTEIRSDGKNPINSFSFNKIYPLRFGNSAGVDIVIPMGKR